MQHIAGRSAVAVAVAWLIALAPGTHAAEATRSAAAFDKRNITGTWDRAGGALDTQRDPTTVRAPLSEIPPPPLKPQFQAAYAAELKKIADANARGEPIANNYTHCIPDGMPTMMQGMFPMEVLQTPGQVTIIQEAYNQVRRIYLNDKLPAIEDAEPGFWGHSVARYEGDTLVVDTVGIKDYVLFRNAPHSANMRINERMRVTGPDTFENAVTVTDPEYLTGPWKWTWYYKRRPNYKMYEYVCEDNREFADPVTGKQRLKIGGD